MHASVKFGFGISGKILSVLTAVLALGSTPCLGSAPYQPVYGNPMLEPWRWHAFLELSGLGAQCAVEGTDGTIWFSAANGIWSYDGIQWICYSSREGVSGNTVALCRGADGSLYAGSQLGVSRFGGSRWTRLFPPAKQNFGEIKKLAVASDGSLWAATSWGALRCQKSRRTLYTTQEIASRLQTNRGPPFVNIELLPDTVIARSRPNALSTNRSSFCEICADQQGRIWLGTDVGEILCYDPSPVQTASNAVPGAAAGKWFLYNESDGLACGRLPSILQLQNGKIWVAYNGASDYLNVFDGVAWQKFRLADMGVPSDCVSLLQTRDGVVWLSGRYVLSACYDGRWQTYTKPAVPIPSAGNFLLQSSDGALWIGGPNTEIQRVDYQTMRWLTCQDLNFQWESPAGAQWFLHRDGRVVVHEGEHWTSYGVEDGLIDAPVVLLGTQNGDVWVAGSHEHTAATARFDGRKWDRFIHDEFSWGVDWRGVLASADGSVWFSAAVDTSGPQKHRDGILQFRDGVWIHHHQPGRAFQNDTDDNPATLLPATQSPEPIGKFVCVGESRDGKIWAGRSHLVFQDGHKWAVYPQPDFRFGLIETMFTTRERDLWVGTQQSGAIRYDGRAWQQFQGKDSLEANTVRSITQTADGTIWAATDRGVSRFDGQTWTADLLPEQLNIPNGGGNLKASPSGALWINHFPPEWVRRAWPKTSRRDALTNEFWTVRHQFKETPPRTTITVGTKKVSPPGNLAIFWSGVAPWRGSPNSQLQFSYRLDDQPWSAFTTEQGHSFFTLPAGPHHFEVRVRDRDFNVDPTPATLDFVVLPPVWRQGWFILLLILLTGLIVAQSIRVFLERGRLRRANRGLAAEVEERKRAEKEAARAAHEWQSTFDATNDAIWILDRDNRILRANKNAESCFHRLNREMIGKTCWEIMHGATGPVPDCPSVRARKSGHRETMELQSDGHWFEIIVDPILDAAGQHAGAVHIVSDITQRKQAAERIREQALLLDAASDAIYIRAMDHTVTYWNDGAERLYGWTRAEAIGRPVQEFIQYDQRAFAAAHAALLAQGNWSGELKLTNKAGKEITAFCRWTVLSDEQGRPKEVLAINTDITERKQLEANFLRAQRMEAIGALAGGIAHDLNNILQPILMAAPILRETARDSESQDMLDTVTHCARRGGDIIRQLLTFARGKPGARVPLPVFHLLGEMKKLIHETFPRNIQLHINVPQNLWQVLGDTTQIHQAFMNLCVNARDAMPNGGTLTLAAENLMLDEAFAAMVPDAKPGPYVCVKVSDTGVGIPPENLDLIFDPFFTTKEIGKGTGLGLPTVLGIVRGHGGFVRVNSQVGKGTTFELYLPASLEAKSAAPADHKTLPPRTQGELILVVDDEASVSGVIRRALEKHGYRVLTAAGGAEAMTLFAGHRAEIRAVLTDMMMPGMDGQSLIRALRLLEPKLPVLGITGVGEQAAMKGLEGFEPVVLLPKPFTSATLLSALHQTLSALRQKKEKTAKEFSRQAG